MKMLFKPLGHLFVICWLLFCGAVINAQQVPPHYLFVEVKAESGAPIPEASVLMYNSSGKKTYHKITNREGRASFPVGNGYDFGWDFMIDKKNSLYLIRIIKSGYLTYENILDMRKIMIKEGEYIITSDKSFEVQLIRHHKSKTGGAQKSQLRGLVHNQPP